MPHFPLSTLQGCHVDYSFKLFIHLSINLFIFLPFFQISLFLFLLIPTFLCLWAFAFSNKHYSSLLKTISYFLGLVFIFLLLYLLFESLLFVMKATLQNFPKIYKEHRSFCLRIDFRSQPQLVPFPLSHLKIKICYPFSILYKKRNLYLF